MDLKVYSLHGGKLFRKLDFMNLNFSFIKSYSHQIYYIYMLFHCSSETTPTGSKMSNLLSDQNQCGGTLTEGEDSGFCKSITSMTSSASSLIMTRPTPRLPLKGRFQRK